MQPIVVPIYSEQPPTEAFLEVFSAIVNQEFPGIQFQFVDFSQSNYASALSMTKVLCFGKAPYRGQNYEWVTTYSIAQMMTKPNAASVLVAALQQFTQKPLVDASQITPIRVSPDYIWTWFDMSKPIAVDIETSGNLDIETPEQVKLLSVAFYQPGQLPAVVTGAGIYNAFGDIRQDFLQLIKAIELPIWHNGKFDIRVIEAQTGYRMPNYFDTMLAHHVLNQGAGDHKLKHLAQRYLSAPEWEAGLSKYLKGGAYYENIPTTNLVEYNGWDAFWTYQLYEFLLPQIQADSNAESAFMLEMKASEFLMEVEQFGFAVDIPYAQALEQQMIKDKNNYFSALQSHLNDKTFNPGSWQQIQKAIGKLSGVAYTGSTDEQHLTEYKNTQSVNFGTSLFIDSLLEYRGISKALKTYVQGALTKQVNGRVHTTFLLHGTVTGRLSSSGPNIQNIPREKKFRSLYIG